jgi:hypothetical protein
MADLAMAFHWSVADMADFTFDELMQWHARAHARWYPSKGSD